VSGAPAYWTKDVGRLIHYADRRLEVVRAPDKQVIGSKPSGLWVSVAGPDDWSSWCQSEGFRLSRLAYAAEIEPVGGARILHLRGPSWIDHFHNAYAVSEPRLLRGLTIDWPTVSRKYDGIVIAPYVWSRRLDGDARWYYGWDCASGCIWNPNAIAIARQLEVAA